MCYFLYGAVNEGVNLADFEGATRGFAYRFNLGDAKAVNECVKKCGENYRITGCHCEYKVCPNQ